MEWSAVQAHEQSVEAVAEAGNRSEPELARLQERVNALERELQRVRDVQAIQNLMGRDTVNWVPKNLSQQASFYALDEPDVSVEVGDRGVWKGPDAVRTLFEETFTNPVLDGVLLIHYLATPMIEVAEDGITARGVWRSPGIEAVASDNDETRVPLWSFGSYAVDFIKKAGEWKIWHLHWFRQIKCSYKDAWVDDLSMVYSQAPPDSGVEPTTYHNPNTPETIQESIPPCPAPYGTWGGPDWAVAERMPKPIGRRR